MSDQETQPFGAPPPPPSNRSLPPSRGGSAPRSRGRPPIVRHMRGFPPGHGPIRGVRAAKDKDGANVKEEEEQDELEGPQEEEEGMPAPAPVEADGRAVRARRAPRRFDDDDPSPVGRKRRRAERDSDYEVPLNNDKSRARTGASIPIESEPRGELEQGHQDDHDNGDDDDEDEEEDDEEDDGQNGYVLTGDDDEGGFDYEEEDIEAIPVDGKGAGGAQLTAPIKYRKPFKHKAQRQPKGRWLTGMLKKCIRCNTGRTPQWRTGPDGIFYCNRCAMNAWRLVRAGKELKGTEWTGLPPEGDFDDDVDGTEGEEGLVERGTTAEGVGVGEGKKVVMVNPRGFAIEPYVRPRKKTFTKKKKEAPAPMLLRSQRKSTAANPQVEPTTDVVPTRRSVRDRRESKRLGSPGRRVAGGTGGSPDPRSSRSPSVDPEPPLSPHDKDMLLAPDDDVAVPPLVPSKMPPPSPLMKPIIETRAAAARRPQQQQQQSALAAAGMAPLSADASFPVPSSHAPAAATTAAPVQPPSGAPAAAPPATTVNTVPPRAISKPNAARRAAAALLPKTRPVHYRFPTPPLYLPRKEDPNKKEAGEDEFETQEVPSEAFWAQRMAAVLLETNQPPAIRTLGARLFLTDYSRPPFTNILDTPIADALVRLHARGRVVSRVAPGLNFLHSPFLTCKLPREAEAQSRAVVENRIAVATMLTVPDREEDAYIESIKKQRAKEEADRAMERQKAHLAEIAERERKEKEKESKGPSASASPLPPAAPDAAPGSDAALPAPDAAPIAAPNAAPDAAPNTAPDATPTAPVPSPTTAPPPPELHPSVFFPPPPSASDLTPIETHRPVVSGVFIASTLWPPEPQTTTNNKPKIRKRLDEGRVAFLAFYQRFNPNSSSASPPPHPPSDPTAPQLTGIEVRLYTNPGTVEDRDFISLGDLGSRELFWLTKSWFPDYAFVDQADLPTQAIRKLIRDDDKVKVKGGGGGGGGADDDDDDDDDDAKQAAQEDAANKIMETKGAPSPSPLPDPSSSPAVGVAAEYAPILFPPPPPPYFSFFPPPPPSSPPPPSDPNSIMIPRVAPLLDPYRAVRFAATRWLEGFMPLQIIGSYWYQLSPRFLATGRLYPLDEEEEEQDRIAVDLLAAVAETMDDEEEEEEEERKKAAAAAATAAALAGATAAAAVVGADDDDDGMEEDHAAAIHEVDPDLKEDMV